MVINGEDSGESGGKSPLKEKTNGYAAAYEQLRNSGQGRKKFPSDITNEVGAVRAYGTDT